MKHLIRKILKEQDQFDWVREMNPFQLASGSKFLTFYFYPSITSREFNKYIVPTLKENGIKVRFSGHETIDHMEIHEEDAQHFSVYGDIDYCRDELYDRGYTSHEETRDHFIECLSWTSNAVVMDGREIFGLP